jgi:hypothetical protein
MEPDPLKAEPPKRKHRRFQFRLRTLMIGVTLLAVACGYIGSQAKFVRERNAFRAAATTIGLTPRNVRNWPFVFEDNWLPDDVSWLRKLLGDETMLFIVVVPESSADEIREAKEIYPEARVAHFEPGGRWEPSGDETRSATQP